MDVVVVAPGPIGLSRPADLAIDDWVWGAIPWLGECWQDRAMRLTPQYAPACAICSRRIGPGRERYPIVVGPPGGEIDDVICEECADPHGDSVPADIRAMRGA